MYADAAETAFQFFVHGLQVFGWDIGRVGVELSHDLGHDIFYEVAYVDGIDVLRFDDTEQIAYFIAGISRMRLFDGGMSWIAVSDDDS